MIPVSRVLPVSEKKSYIMVVEEKEKNEAKNVFYTDDKTP